MAARGHHWEGHAPADCCAPARRASHSSSGGKSAWRYPLYGGGEALEAWDRAVPERGQCGRRRLVPTQGAVWLGGEACKRCGRAGALAPWLAWRAWLRAL